MRTVTEIVIASTHISVSTGFEFQERTDKRSGGIVEELIHTFATAGSGKESDELVFSVSGDGGLDIPHGSERGGHGVVDIQFFDFDHVGAISAIGALSIITSLSIPGIGAVFVGVGAGPLEVDPVVGVDGETVGVEVILDGREGLDDVATLATDDDVVDLVVADAVGARLDQEDVRAVLEGAASLGGVDGQLETLHDANVDGGVLLEGRELIVEGGVDEPVDVGGGDVVADAEDAATGLAVLAASLLGGGQGPVVGGHVSVEGVSEVVVTRPDGHLARNVRRTAKTAEGIAVPVTTLIGLGGENGNVLPGILVPPGVVVTLLRAFVATAVTVGVLAGVLGGVSVQVLIGGPQALVAGDVVTAIGVVLTGFMETSGSVVGVLGRGVGGGSIAEVIAAHVLQDVLAADLSVVATGVLVGPFDREDGAFEEGHLMLFIGGIGGCSTGITNVVASTVVVLRVKHTVAVVTIG